jgi:cobalt-zinc-cadmium efflux system outer membrane protein
MFTVFLRATAMVAVMLPAYAAAAPFTLDQAVDVAIKRSELTRSRRAGVASASAMASASGELPDPVLRVALEDLPVTGADRFHTARDSMTTKRVELAQEWLSTDKRAARRAAADAVVSRESITWQAAAANTRLQTTLAFLDAFYAAEALKLTTLMEHHAHEELALSRARLASATSSSQEVLGLTGALGIAEDDVAEVTQQQVVANVAMERWVGFHSDEIASPGSFAIPSEAVYVARHPTVMTMRRDTDVAERAVAVAAANRNPNWSWEVGYAQRTGFSDLFTVGVSIPLPIARERRQDRETASKLALVERADADLADAVRMATAEYRSLIANEQRFQERISRYQQGVVVIAEQRTLAATASYRSNQTNLVTLFEARHAEVDARRKLLTLQRELAKTEAELAFRPLSDEAAR